VTAGKQKEQERKKDMGEERGQSVFFKDTMPRTHASNQTLAPNSHSAMSSSLGQSTGEVGVLMIQSPLRTAFNAGDYGDIADPNPNKTPEKVAFGARNMEDIFFDGELADSKGIIRLQR
jgi:hypothetical protein